MAKKLAVKICFPGITIGDVIYNKGEIVTNPSKELLRLAKEKARQYHRDSKKELRIAKLIHQPVDDEVDEDEIEESFEEKFVKKAKERKYNDGLETKSNSLLIEIVVRLGLKKKVATTFNKKQLISLIRFLREL